MPPKKKPAKDVDGSPVAAAAAGTGLGGALDLSAILAKGQFAQLTTGDAAPVTAPRSATKAAPPPSAALTSASTKAAEEKPAKPRPSAVVRSEKLVSSSSSTVPDMSFKKTSIAPPSMPELQRELRRCSGLLSRSLAFLLAVFALGGSRNTT